MLRNPSCFCINNRQSLVPLDWHPSPDDRRMVAPATNASRANAVSSCGFYPRECTPKVSPLGSTKNRDLNPPNDRRRAKGSQECTFSCAGWVLGNAWIAGGVSTEKMAAMGYQEAGAWLLEVPMTRVTAFHQRPPVPGECGTVTPRQVVTFSLKGSIERRCWLNGFQAAVQLFI